MRFVGIEPQEKVLKEYLQFVETRRNAMYFSVNTVSMFVKVVSVWMRDESMAIVRNCDHFASLLDESTD